MESRFSSPPTPVDSAPNTVANNRILLAVASFVMMLLVGVIVVVILLLRDTSVSQPALNQSPVPIGSDFTGHVSDLKGGTVSTRSLKGLTMRINQIDTCNPKIVSAFVAVSSDAGQVNKNFGKGDVKVYLDGKQVTNFDFASVNTAKLPLANIMVIDHSGSMRGVAMDTAKSAAATYISRLLPNDQVGVIQFDTSVDVLVAVSTDKAKAQSAIHGISARGDTALYDALNSAVGSVPNCGRKAITVLTDGEDTASKTSSVDSVIAEASKVNIPIFAVGIKSAGYDSSNIRKISEATGAQYLEANTPQEISDLYGKIDGQLTGQFAANLHISLPKDGSTHTLKIISTVEGSDTQSERTFVY